MAASTVVKNLNDGLITIKDGTGTPLSCAVKFDNGTFAVSGLKKKMSNTVAYESRGVYNGVRHTGRVYPTFSFTCKMSEFTSATANSVSDAIAQNGAFAAAVSTSGANADVYTLDVVIAVEGTNFGDSGDHTFTLEDCELQFDWAEGDPDTFSISGTCYGDVTGDLAVDTP